MDDLYRDEILEHYRRPHNFGTLPAPDAVQEGYNPLCGDRITLMLGFDGDAVREVAFTGRGCAISQASASMLTDRIKGKPLGEVGALTNDDVLEELGIEISPARLKCALLSVETLRQALDGSAPAGDGATGASRSAPDTRQSTSSTTEAAS